MPEAVVDTAPLQYLHQLEQLELLTWFYGRPLCPPAVVHELAAGRALGVSLPDPDLLPWLVLRTPRSTRSLELVVDLGAGEREVLALASELETPLVVSDDALARRYARLLRLPVTGTLGVLLRAKREGLVEPIRPLVDDLERRGFRLDPKTRQRVLDLAGEGG